ncbi:hypothetical protein JFV28_21135, partial [Pseudomonas sp. TH05]|nr:hypothetical protein [Pseudomonas sp. TH05]
MFGALFAQPGKRRPAPAGTLQAGSPHALADEQVYAEVCEQIRHRGLHHVHGLLMGVDALSAPVFDAMGKIAAVLTVSGRPCCSTLTRCKDIAA